MDNNIGGNKEATDMDASDSQASGYYALYDPHKTASKKATKKNDNEIRCVVMGQPSLSPVFSVPVPFKPTGQLVLQRAAKRLKRSLESRGVSIDQLCLFAVTASSLDEFQKTLAGAQLAAASGSIFSVSNVVSAVPFVSAVERSDIFPFPAMHWDFDAVITIGSANDQWLTASGSHGNYGYGRNMAIESPASRREAILKHTNNVLQEATGNSSISIVKVTVQESTAILPIEKLDSVLQGEDLEGVETTHKQTVTTTVTRSRSNSELNGYRAAYHATRLSTKSIVSASSTSDTSKIISTAEVVDQQGSYPPAQNSIPNMARTASARTNQSDASLYQRFGKLYKNMNSEPKRSNSGPVLDSSVSGWETSNGDMEVDWDDDTSSVGLTTPSAYDYHRPRSIGASSAASSTFSRLSMVAKKLGARTPSLRSYQPEVVNIRPITSQPSANPAPAWPVPTESRSTTSFAAPSVVSTTNLMAPSGPPSSNESMSSHLVPSSLDDKRDKQSRGFFFSCC